MDYTEIRLLKQCVLASQNIKEDVIDESYTLYFDETNNIKKFYIREDGSTNVPNDTIFVLGGLEGKDVVTFKELKEYFHLQDNVKEIKSHHIYSGTFVDCLKSKKLNAFLDLIKTHGWHVHFQTLNLLYWSLVDIIDSIKDSKEEPDKINFYKAFLYRVAKYNGDNFISILHKYKYPNIKDQESLKSFFEELIVHTKSYGCNDDINLEKIKRNFIKLLEKGANQKEAIFIQNEQPLQLIKELTEFYSNEIYTWKNCNLIFDEETDIMQSIKKNTIELNGKPMTNYSFVNSQNNVMIQLSDVTIGIISKYLQFIDENSCNLPNMVSSFNEVQMENFNKLNQVLRASLEYNPVFFHQTTSIEYHRLLNEYIGRFC